MADAKKKRREEDATRRLPRDEQKKHDAKKKSPLAKRERDSTAKIKRADAVKERENTTELDLGDVEVVAEKEEKGEPTQRTNKSSPERVSEPPPPPKPKLPDPFEVPSSLPKAADDDDADLFDPAGLGLPPAPAGSAEAFNMPEVEGVDPPESWQEDDIDTSEWSTNPVKRLLKKLKK